MTSLNKKKKCSHTALDRGGQKGSLFRLKRHAMYHKKDRVAGKKLANQPLEPDEEE